MTTFYKFVLKIETSWAEKISNPILETMMLLHMFGSFILG